MQITAVPRPVRDFARDVQEATGENPQIEQVTALSWRITLEGRHVRAWAGFRSARGRTRWDSGGLEIDGDPRPAVSFTELRVLWVRHEREAAAPAPLEPVPPPSEDGMMPAAVRHVHDQLAGAAGHDVTLSAGCDGSRWVVGNDAGRGDGVRFIFTRAARTGHWTLDRIQLIVDGIDESAGIGRDVSRAIAMLAPRGPGDDRKLNVPRGKPAAAARDTGIEMRKGNVIRVLPAGAWHETAQEEFPPFTAGRMSKHGAAGDLRRGPGRGRGARPGGPGAAGPGWRVRRMTRRIPEKVTSAPRLSYNRE